MRILLPALDKDRGAYGVKEKKLADLYIKILGIQKTSPDAVKLINYRWELLTHNRLLVRILTC